MDQEIRFCTSFDGTRIAYATMGTGSPLVRTANWLTHLEFDGTGPIWSHWFDELSRNHRFIRYDCRGTGLSDRRVDDLSLDAWVRDLDAVVDDLELERFPLLGLCQGGTVALAYAARHPERVSRLILYDSYARGRLVEDASPRDRKQAETLAELIKIGWGRHTAAFRQIFVNLLMPEASENQQRWLATVERQSASTEMAVRLWRAFHSIDIRALAPRIQVPTLVFHVKNDAMVPFESGRHLASLIPGARFVPLPGENHILRAEEPAWDHFVSELRRFLAEEDPSLRAQDDGFCELTPRECEVLDLVAQGTGNRQIAERLFISPKTVRNHITRIYSKLQVDGRAEAIVQAREAGFGHNGPL